MKLLIAINLDNAAYSDEGSLNLYEISHNLYQISQNILLGSKNGSVKDRNGNIVGFFEMQREASDIQGEE